MARNRYTNPIAQASRAVYGVELSNGERLIISWLLGQIEGLDKEGSRKTAAIIEELGLEELDNVSQDTVNAQERYELSGYEVRFILDELDQVFDSRKVKAVQAKHAIGVYDKLKGAMETPGESEPPPETT